MEDNTLNTFSTINIDLTTYSIQQLNQLSEHLLYKYMNTSNNILLNTLSLVSKELGSRDIEARMNRL